MALTGTERALVRRYAGWGARFLQFDDALENAMLAIANSPDDEALVRADLTECQRIDTSVQAAESRLKASKVGTIELNGGEIEQLRDRGRQAVARMCRTLSVESRGDAFSGAPATDRGSAVGMLGAGGYQMQG